MVIVSSLLVTFRFNTPTPVSCVYILLHQQPICKDRSHPRPRNNAAKVCSIGRRSFRSVRLPSGWPLVPLETSRPVPLLACHGSFFDFVTVHYPVERLGLGVESFSISLLEISNRRVSRFFSCLYLVKRRRFSSSIRVNTWIESRDQPLQIVASRYLYLSSSFRILFRDLFFRKEKKEA